jgi:uncharacterized protein YdhG (YjbR/CyaY superfamily)
MSATKSKPRTIDEYPAGVTADQRGVLDGIRKTIRTVVPEAEECISYGLAAFRLNRRPLVAFGAWANHCAFSPMPEVAARLKEPNMREMPFEDVVSAAGKASVLVLVY